MNRLGKLMTMLNPEKAQMPSAEDALPGRGEMKAKRTTRQPTGRPYPFTGLLDRWRTFVLEERTTDERNRKADGDAES